MLYAVYEKEHPNRVWVFEMYTDAHAYQTHLETPHFKKFLEVTKKMMISKTLLDAVPIALGAKTNIAPSAN
ncbi:putative quinol monooxygenase [Collimonas sp. OK242]|uniref:putative quinol monooxygenase n=1 Tax=Collimonas sp. OK242 TaxID=1798195 RepID=UPI0035153AEE